MFVLVSGYAMSHHSLHSSSSVDSPMTPSGAYAIDMSGRQHVSHQVISTAFKSVKISSHFHSFLVNIIIFGKCTPINYFSLLKHEIQDALT